jgi:RNA polymerase sigma-70 factor (ECF subfamily)
VGEDEEGRDEDAPFEALGNGLSWDETAHVLGHSNGQALREALSALPARQREAVKLCRYAGLSERQAAAQMRISAGALRSHLNRGLQTLLHLPET